MPGGPGLIGFTAFVSMKFAGYAAAAVALRKIYPAAQKGILAVGAARTAIGLAVGGLYGAAFLYGPARFGGGAHYLFYGGLFPVRLVEWSLLLHWFYDRSLRDRLRAMKAVLLGTVWSYVLDIIGVATALVIPGGFWVC